MTNSPQKNSLIDKREAYSLERIDTLREKLKTNKQLGDFPGLTVFGAGSYGRLEASEYSDIDMFFLCVQAPDQLNEPNTKKIRMFSSIIEVVDQLNYPKFSNDGEFLRLLHLDEMIQKLGGIHDDYENHFTTRMLLLLESTWLYNETIYQQAIKKIVEPYYRDFNDHKENFKPIFLINDIVRYWKTLCLNYEFKRNQKADAEKKIRQKVKNFKLKISRMTTCFATIAALSCHREPVKINDVINLVKLTPRQRLLSIEEKVPDSSQIINKIFNSYNWFLKMTGYSTTELRSHFSNKEKRKEMSKKANDFGDLMYKLLQIVDDEYKIFRYLVI